ncbi:MAG: reverse transcriptase family protein, partial [Sedimenticola sp.]
MTKRINKLHSPEIIHLFETSDLVIFTETWTDNFSELNVDGFEFCALHREIKNPKAKRNSGGIVVYVRNALVDGNTFLTCVSDSHIWLKLSSNSFAFENDLYICAAYVIPEGSSRQSAIESDVFSDISNYMIDILEHRDPNCNFMLIGDLNSRCGSLPDHVVDDADAHIPTLPDDYVTDTGLSRVTQDRVINNNGRRLIDFCKETGTRIANGRVGGDNGKCTYVGSNGSSLVDLVIVNADILNYFSSFVVHDPNILSDHCVVQFALRCVSTTAQNNNHVDRDKSEQIGSYYKWNNDVIDSYKTSLELPNIQCKFHSLTEILSADPTVKDIDDSVLGLNDIFDIVCTPLFKKANYPSSTHAQSHKSDIHDASCDVYKTIFMNKLNAYRIDKTDVNRQNMVSARSDFKKAVRAYRFQQSKQKNNNLLAAKVNNAKEYWKLLKQASGIRASPKIPADSFVEYFRAINNPSDPFFQADEDIIHFNEIVLNAEIKIMFEELNVEISCSEIDSSIMQLKNSKSGGPDMVLNEFLIHGKAVLLPFLSALFNAALNKGYFPDAWGEGHIVPIHKKGNINLVNNYRGITLLSTIGKLFTRILNNRLTNWAEQYFVYVESQAGFRKNMGTVDQIFVLHGLISHIINKGSKLFCAFVDFSKAFDYIVRENMWYKLIKLGIRGKLFNVIKSLYENIKSNVKFNNTLSDEFSCELGVRQGECLSPFLFDMFVNDLEDEFYLKGVEGIAIGMIKMLLFL